MDFKSASPAVVARRIATQFWGEVQSQRKVGDGIWWLTTAGHGGFVVDVAVRTELSEFKSEVTRNGLVYSDEQHFAAFEEDCMAVIVEWTYPDIMPAVQKMLCAYYDGPAKECIAERIEIMRNSLQRWNPDWLKKWPEPGVKVYQES